MLKASLNFDFEEAAAELNKIAQALNISIKQRIKRDDER